MHSRWCRYHAQMMVPPAFEAASVFQSICQLCSQADTQHLTPTSIWHRNNLYMARDSRWVLFWVTRSLLATLPSWSAGVTAQQQSHAAQCRPDAQLCSMLCTITACEHCRGHNKAGSMASARADAVLVAHTVSCKHSIGLMI